MKKQNNKFTHHYPLLTAIYLVFCIVLLTGCPKPEQNNTNANPNSNANSITSHTPSPYSEIPKDSSIILWKNPNASDTAFKLWKKNHHLSNAKKLCPFCTDEDDLELYEGVSIQVFGGGGNNPPPCTLLTPPCKPSGGADDTVYYCYNIPINLVTPFFKGEKFEAKDSQIRYHDNIPDPVNFDIPSQDGITGDLVNIGIFDTGVDPSITTKYTTPLPGACKTSAASGWNYAYGNKDTKDDYPGMHGTTVTKFIIDQAVKYRNQRVNIIPVKIFDSVGHTSLYKILCAIIYAQKSGIQVINASFGFYWHDLQTPPVLFNAFVHEYLTKHKILLIAAAGNRDFSEDYTVEHTGLVTHANLRNLEMHPCYPASLAGQADFDNVIAVTTSSKADDKVSPQQNFSKTIVDVGVNGDISYSLNLPSFLVPTEEFGFKDPLGRTSPGGGLYIISGSSYATPIITGKIASFYSQLIGSGPIKKPSLLSALLTKNLTIHSTGTGLNAQVRNGSYAPKN